MKRPRPALLIALLAAAAVSAFALLNEGGTELVQPAARTTAPARAGGAAATPEHALAASTDPSLRLAPRPAPAVQPRDVFAAYSWAAQAAAAMVASAPAQPPPPPQAPPLPVMFGGVIELEGQPVFLLIEGEHTLRVVVGGKVDAFRLQSANPRELVFVHIPTGLTQTLSISGAPLALVH
jgi:hypothetical protein